MKVKNVRGHLSEAAEEIQDACDAPADVDTEEWLRRIVSHLNHFVEGDTDDPEAMVYPSADALETIEARLSEVIERTDDEAVIEHLETARSRIRDVMETLDDRA